MTSEVTVEYGATKHTEKFSYPAAARDIVAKAPAELAADKKDVLAICVNGLLMPLSAVIPGHKASVSLVLSRSKEGREILKRSIIFLMKKAVAKVYPKWFVTIEHDAFAGPQFDGVMCAVDEGSHAVTQEELSAVKAEMLRLVGADLPITQESLPRDEALAYFEGRGSKFTVKLLEQCNTYSVDCAACEGHYEIRRRGPYVLSTGAQGMDCFDLVPFENSGSFVLGFQKDCKEMHADPAMARNFVKWNKNGHDIFHTDCLGEANERLMKEGLFFKAFCEEVHNDMLVKAVEKVHERYESGARLVLIAGPSSSGKTTFAHKLAMELRVSGMEPLILSVDNYYKAHEDCPRDENGKIDFEVVEALRVELLNKDLIALFNGETIHSPVFDFKAGRASDTQTIPAKLPPHGVVIMEGIHCLNDRLTPSIPKEKKVKIFIGPLSHINIDENYVVGNNTVRLIRRIVRDFRSRGYTALDTLGRWESVRRGEDKHVFPFIKEADVVCNTSLCYEVSALKSFCLPLLTSVKPGSEYYQMARELEEFMSLFVETPYDDVPAMSILREFIGGGFFHTG